MAADLIFWAWISFKNCFLTLYRIVSQKVISSVIISSCSKSVRWLGIPCQKWSKKLRTYTVQTYIRIFDVAKAKAFLCLLPPTLNYCFIRCNTIPLHFERSVVSDLYRIGSRISHRGAVDRYFFLSMGWARVCVEYYRKSRTVIKNKNRIVNIFLSSYDVWIGVPH